MSNGALVIKKHLLVADVRVLSIFRVSAPLALLGWLSLLVSKKHFVPFGLFTLGDFGSHLLRHKVIWKHVFFPGLFPTFDLLLILGRNHVLRFGFFLVFILLYNAIFFV